MTETTLVVARHGATFNKGDVILRVGSRTNLPLTADGRAQSRRLACLLAERDLIPTAIYSASLKRTLETSAEIVDELCLDLKPSVEKFLLELDYGDDDGLPEKEVEIRLGAAEAENPEELSQEELANLGKAALKRWNKERILPKGWAFLQKRVDSLPNAWRNFGEKLVRQECGEVVVAATSNGIARFSWALLPEDAPRPADSKLAVGAFGILVWNGENWRLDGWNIR